jgi:glycosyltransferase involved in cell wall biosynthesis
MRAPLVVFGEDWGGHPSSTQHLIRRLMSDQPVVWVNSIGLRRPRLTDIYRVFKKGMAAISPSVPIETQEDEEKAPDALIHPFAIPVARNGIERKFNRIFLGNKIREALRPLSNKKPILWTSLPTAVDLLGCADEQAVVYYCGDDFSGLAGVDHAQVAEAEKKLVERADLILVASERLGQKFPDKNNIVYLPHGVDVELFSTPCSSPNDLPANRPVAGFYGSISEWIDVELLSVVASTLPDWQFVFIGHLHTDVTVLSKLENVTFLGPKKHDELPAYVQNWTVSLLPFRDNAQIRACNPLKLREYLSAGTPVVSSDFPALDGYRDLIALANGPEEFASAIIDTLNDPAKLRAQRRARVAEESWDNRARDVAELLSKL